MTKHFKGFARLLGSRAMQAVKQGRVTPSHAEAFRQKVWQMVFNLDKSVAQIFVPASWSHRGSTRVKAVQSADETMKYLASDHLLLSWAQKIQEIEKRAQKAHHDAARHGGHGVHSTGKLLAGEANKLEGHAQEHRAAFEKAIFVHYGSRLGAKPTYSVEPDVGAHNAAQWLIEHHELLLKMFPEERRLQ